MQRAATSPSAIRPPLLSPSLLRARRFAQIMQETEPTELRPVFNAEGVSYIYTQVRTQTPRTSCARRHRQS